MMPSIARRVMLVISIFAASVAGAPEFAHAQTISPDSGFPLGVSFEMFATRANLKSKCKGRSNPCRNEIKNAEAGRPAHFDSGDYGFLFEGGKLVLIEAHTPDFEGFVAEATGKYGKPAALEYRELANNFGVKFKAGSARWNLTDGSVVTAMETITFGPVIDDYMRTTDVTICTAQKRKELDSAGAYKPVLPPTP
jgi:hypothetical protein